MPAPDPRLTEMQDFRTYDVMNRKIIDMLLLFQTQTSRYAAKRILELEAECEQLREDLAELIEDAFCQIAHKQSDGWWSSQALSSAVSLGDKLVELALWEKNAFGHGRVQLYRPVAAEQEPSQ